MIKLRVSEPIGDPEETEGIGININGRYFTLIEYEDVVQMLKDLGLDVEED